MPDGTVALLVVPKSDRLRGPVMIQSASHEPAPEASALAERFEAASMRLGRAMGHGVLARVGSGLTMPQYHILRMAAAGDCLRVSDMADRLGIQPSAITAMVDRLVVKGLAERERDTTDRRIVHVCATDAGRAEIDKVSEALRAWFRDVFDALEPGEAQEFVRIFEKLERVATEGRDA